MAVRPAQFSPIRALTSAVWLAAAGVALSAAKTFAGVGIPCPWRAVTGTLCPFCGGTTLGVHLLHGDVGAAFAANQFVFVLLAAYALAVVAWTVEALGGPALRPPARLRRASLWWIVFGVCALTFMVVRNVV